MKPTFEEFSDFIREVAGLPASTEITPATRFEKDLGITGDDGSDLLTDVERKFGVLLHSKEDGYRKTFNLEQNEFLFNSEGFNPFQLITMLLKKSGKSKVRDFTVGELFEAVCRSDLNEVQQGRCT